MVLKTPVNADDHIRGNLQAPVTLVEYGDYQCPFCRIAHGNVLLVERYFGDKLVFAFRHFPLSQVHPFAEAAAETAEFAGAYDRFWEAHDSLYEHQDRLGPPLFLTLVRYLGLSEAELQAALAARTYAPKVRNDFLGGVRSGVNGTPTFFIGSRRHDGSYEFDDLVAAIEARLRAEEAS
jgi:protein-disulfide isomerase